MVGRFWSSSFQRTLSLGFNCGFISTSACELSPKVCTEATLEDLGLPQGGLGFPGGLDGKESECNSGDLSLILGLGRSPGEGNGNPIPVFLLGKPHEQRSLVGYSPRGLRVRHN